MTESRAGDDEQEVCLRCGTPREPELTTCRSCGFEFAPPLPDLDEPLPDDTADEVAPLPNDLLSTLFAPTLDAETQLVYERGRHVVLERIGVAAMMWILVVLIPIFGLLVLPIALVVHVVMAGMVARRTGSEIAAPTVAVLAGVMALFSGSILLMLLGTMARPGEFFGSPQGLGWLLIIGTAGSLVAEVRVFAAALDLRAAMARAQEAE